MQTKHTPGPWNFAKSDIDGRYSIYGNGPLAYCGDTGAVNGDGEANARLIAAAPDLLVALKALVGEADLGEVDLDDDDRAKLEQARAAIAKATGDQP